MKLRVESPLSQDLERLIQQVIGAAIEVHRHLGPGFLESIYERALCHEFELCKIVYKRQKQIKVPYKKTNIPGQRLDILVENRLIVEVKAVKTIAPIYQAKLLSYLKSTHLRAGLIINFNVILLKTGIRRIVR